MRGARWARPVGVCGEAASDPLLALVLVGLGVASLSMARASLPDVRGALALQTHDACHEIAFGGARGAARREVALSRACG